MTVILDKNGHAITDGLIAVYCFTPDTHEYIGCVDEYLSKGIGLPANSTILSPGNIPSGSAAIFEDDVWNVLPDLRGKTAYSTKDREAIVIDYIGELHSGFTLIVPGKFDCWDGSQWVTDSKAKHAADVEAADQQKQALLDNAAETTSDWKTELALGIISDEDKASLIEWMNYTKAVKAVDTSKTPDITWPTAPEGNS